MIKGIEHIGIAVRSIEKSERLYTQAMKLKVVSRETLDDRKLKVAFIDTGNVFIELLEPMEGEAVISKFIARRGEGIHHICFETDDIAAAQKEMTLCGIRLLSEKADKGSRGTLVNFIHPASASGVLIEISQPNIKL